MDGKLLQRYGQIPTILYHSKSTGSILITKQKPTMNKDRCGSRSRKIGSSIYLLIAVFLLSACQWQPEAVIAPERIYRFLAIGDMGTGGSDQKKVAKTMRDLIDSEGADFLLFLGDNFYPTGVSSVTDPQWKTTYEDIYGLWGIPVYPALGNHDYGGNGAGNEAWKGPIQVAYSLQSSTWNMPANFYRFDRGPAVFVALDTNELKMRSADTLDQGASVTRWFAGFLGWKIAFGHHPYLSNGPHGNAAVDNTPFQLLFEKSLADRADLYFAGHDHDLQVLKLPVPVKRPLLVVSGGGGPLALLPLTTPPPPCMSGCSTPMGSYCIPPR